MALFRALESLRAPGTRLFLDPDAARFLGGFRKHLYRFAGIPGCLRLAEAVLDGAAPGARAAGIARTKWLDDRASEAMRAATQLVLLGAGFDTRAWRLPAAASARVFEVDHPETAAAKRATLESLGRTAGDRVQYVAVDFNRESVAERLLAAGFDGAQPSCWIWEGVTNYLTPEAVDGTLREIRATTDSGVLLFTYIERAVLDHPERFAGAAKLIARLQSYGEPWTFGLDPAGIREYLGGHGFGLLEDRSAAEVWRAAGRPGMQSRGYEFYRLAACRTAGSAG